VSRPLGMAGEDSKGAAFWPMASRGPSFRGMRGALELSGVLPGDLLMGKAPTKMLRNANHHSGGAAVSSRRYRCKTWCLAFLFGCGSFIFRVMQRRFIGQSESCTPRTRAITSKKI